MEIGFFPDFLLSWKYWKLKSSTFSIVLRILDFFYVPISWKYWILDSSVFSYPGNTGGGRAAAGARLRGLGLFLERVPGKTTMVALELRSKQALFWKRLPRPNQYAHKICIEILCRTPVSILKYLSPRPQNHMKNFKYSSLAWMSTWISRCRRRRRCADNSPIWTDP